MSIELPKDAEGREIPLDTEVLYDECGTKVSVKEFLSRMSVENRRTEWTIKAAYEGNFYYNSFKPKNMLIDHDLTQGDFSKTLGISTSYFSELLNGRKSISLSILFSIAEETGVDIHELVIEVGE